MNYFCVDRIDNETTSHFSIKSYSCSCTPSIKVEIEIDNCCRYCFVVKKRHYKLFVKFEISKLCHCAVRHVTVVTENYVTKLTSSYQVTNRTNRCVTVLQIINYEMIDCTFMFVAILVHHYITSK